MLAAWIGYSLVTAALVTGAALALEWWFRAMGRAVRWVWVGASVLSLSLPLVALVTGGRYPGGVMGGGFDGASERAAGAGPVVPLEVGAAEGIGSWLVSDAVLAATWLAATLWAGLWYAGVWRRLAVSSRTWRRERLAGRSVLVSRNGGPAAVGLLRPSIVVPEWLLETSEGVQRMVVLHEAEHVRVRDHALLALAPLPLILFPWNVFLWLQRRRLRLAVELDCDRRVLGRGVDVEAYATLLLEIAARPRGHVLAASLSLPDRRPLEKRLLAMTGGPLRWRKLRVAGAAAAALLLLGLACETDPPVAPAPDAAPPPVAFPVGDLADGVEAGRIRVYVDGRRVGRPELDGLAPSDVATVEVRRSEFSLEREAASAPAGTIFIRTKRATAGQAADSAERREWSGRAESAIADAPAGTVYLIDGRVASAADASALRPGDIVTVEVKRANRNGVALPGQVRITTVRGQR